MSQSKQQTEGRNVLLYPRTDGFLLLPGFMGWLVLFFIPVLLSIESSFRMDAVDDLQIGWNNYTILIQDSYFMLSLKNTFFFLFLSILGMTILGLLMARLLFAFPQSSWMIPLLLFPLLLPAPSLAPLWNAMTGSGSWIVRIIQPKSGQWKYVALLLLFLWKNVGTITTLFLLGLRTINREILDAARVDGAVGYILFFRIELPLLQPLMVYSLLYGTMCGIRIYREAYLLYGAYPPDSLFFMQHYSNLCYARLEYGRMSAAGTIFTLLLAIPFAFILRNQSVKGGDML